MGLKDTTDTSNGMAAEDLEQRVADIWSDVLGQKQIDKEADLFALGGNSITAAQIIGRMRDDLRMPSLPLMLIFEYPTVAEMTTAIRELPSTIA